MTADVPVVEVEAVDAVLDALDTPTSSEVYSAVEPFSNSAVAAAAAARAIAGGGGSSLPDEWTVGDDGSLDIAISDSSGLLTLKRGSGSGSFVQSGVIDQGGGIEDAIVRVTGIGGGGGCAVQVANGSAAGTSTTIDGDGRLALFTTTGEGAIEAWDDAGNTLRFALLPAGQPMIGALAAPADGDLSAGQVALWFDATNGAAKLKIKGKSENGTIVTGEVALG